MIICIDIKDNDYGEIIENYMKNFLTNLVYDYRKLCCDIKKEEEKQRKKVNTRVFIELYEYQDRINNLLNPNINTKLTNVDKEFLKDRIIKSLKVFLEYNGIIFIKDEMIDYLINQIEVTFPRAFYDKWENGEKFYYFKNSGIVINQ